MADQRIIIKKVKKADHGGGHGGSSWKVAYADFVTALMAFFLLLWLISMASPVKRAQVSHYFNTFSLFDNSGTSIINGEDPVKINIGNLDGQPRYGPSGKISDGELDANQREEFVEKLKKEIETKLADVENQILIESSEKGVRVEIVDLADSPIFALGSSQITAAGRKILAVVARTLAKTRHHIVIEGHTDARVYSSQYFSNWELSTERASAARIELEKNGLPPDLLLQVTGFAATQPLIQNDPMDPRNRRISIMVYSSDGSGAAMGAIGQWGPDHGNATVASAALNPSVATSR
jgi:chemotaxis protein MotB